MDNKDKIKNSPEIKDIPKLKKLHDKKMRGLGKPVKK